MKLNSDNKQRLTAGISFILEFYKMIMGTFLVAIIPQDCHGMVCSVTDNIFNNNLLYIFANSFNLISFITLLYFGIAQKSVKKDRIYSAYMKLPEIYNTIDVDHANIVDNENNNKDSTNSTEDIDIKIEQKQKTETKLNNKTIIFEGIKLDIDNNNVNILNNTEDETIV